MLQKTMLSASATATISSHVVGVPQAVKAGAKNHSITTSSSLADVHEDLVGLDHAQLAARLLLDHLQAFLQVAHFIGQAVIGLLGLHVGGALRVELLLQG